LSDYEYREGKKELKGGRKDEREKERNRERERERWKRLGSISQNFLRLSLNARFYFYNILFPRCKEQRLLRSQVLYFPPIKRMGRTYVFHQGFPCSIQLKNSKPC
jgi:hypothetical protein